MIPFNETPSSMLASNSSRSAEFALSITARRLTTTLLRLTSNLITLNSNSMFSRCVISRRGLTSTSEPGRNARKPRTSTVNPPLTLPLITPVTISSLVCAASSSIQDSARRAFSRESRVAPNPSSTASRDTCTSSPTLTSSSPLSLKNCSAGITPSDFKPA